MSETVDILRIIARDGGRIDAADRARLVLAADELERALHVNGALQASLIEANAHRLALTEQVLDLRKAQRLPDLMPWSLSSGWMRVEAPK